MTEAEISARKILQEYLDSSPFHNTLRMEVEAVDKEQGILNLRLKYSDMLERAVGSKQYHGGVIAAFIDVAGDFALISMLSYGVPTINFRVDYLRPAPATDLIATTRVRRAGRTFGVVDIDVHDEQGRLVAVGRGCYGTQKG